MSAYTNKFYNEIIDFIKVKYNITETDNSYIIEIPAIGINKENITIDQKTSIIEVTSNQKFKDDYIYQSFFYKNIDTKYDLSKFENIDINNITSSLNNGVLTLTIAKLKEEEIVKKKIEIL